jgi:hypothetical protein
MPYVLPLSLWRKHGAKKYWVRNTTHEAVSSSPLSFLTILISKALTVSPTKFHTRVHVKPAYFKVIKRCRQAGWCRGNYTLGCRKMAVIVTEVRLYFCSGGDVGIFSKRSQPPHSKLYLVASVTLAITETTN